MAPVAECTTRKHEVHVLAMGGRSILAMKKNRKARFPKWTLTKKGRIGSPGGVATRPRRRTEGQAEGGERTPCGGLAVMEKALGEETFP